MAPEYRYEIIIFWSDPHAAFVAHVRELAGCSAFGATYREALENGEGAIRAWIENARGLGRLIPGPRNRLAEGLVDSVARAVSADKAEELRRQNEQQLAMALEAAKLGVWIWDIASDIVTWTSSTGVAVAPASGVESLSELLARVHPEDRDRVEDITRAAAEHGTKYELEFRLERRDGTYGWNLGKGVAVRDTGGAVTQLVGIGTDIDERRRAEEAASRQHKFLNVILETLTEGVVACDATGRLTLFNRALRETHGLPAEPIPPEQWAEHYDLFRSDGKTPMALEEIPLFRALRGEDVRDVEMVVAPKGRSMRSLLASGRAITDADGRVAGAVVAMHDITDRKRAEAALHETEEQLRQGQKMEAVGRLAGGIAHDFNNMLSAIKSYAELLLEDLAPESPHADDVAEISKAADRAAVLTRQLLAFSRRQILQLRTVQLNDVVGEMRGMLARLIGEDIDMVFDLDPALWPTCADSGQIQQVLMNLAVNARDAMPKGGTLKIETPNTQMSENDLSRSSSVRPGSYAQVRVSDTGQGMDEATLSRIFEPFFTTKALGQGTGLGLATVYGIITQSGGHVGVHSEPGRGTTFEILLPRDEGIEDVPEVRRARARQPARAGTILLVEDEEMVRDVAVRVLRKQGYMVIHASNGQDALRAAAGLPGRDRPFALRRGNAGNGRIRAGAPHRDRASGNARGANVRLQRGGSAAPGRRLVGRRAAREAVQR